MLFFTAPAYGELLVRLPLDTPNAEVSALTKPLERKLGQPVLGVAAAAPAPKDVAPVPKGAKEQLEKAKTAYKGLALDEALTLLEGIENACLDYTTYNQCRSFLFDAHMLRGMAQMALNDTSSTIDQAFRSAHIVEPTRVLNPKQYPPHVMRRFAKAWTDSDVTVTCHLIGKPVQTQFWLNGHPVTDAILPLPLGRHIIEARFLGYETQYKIVEIHPSNLSPFDLSFELVSHPDPVAWQTLVRRISNPEWRGDDPEVAALLRRFNIHAVLLLGPSEKGRYSAAVVVEESPGIQTLPPFSVCNNTVSIVFTNSLKRTLGLPVERPPVVTQPNIVGPTIVDAFDDDDTEEDAINDNEDPSVRFGDTEDPIDGAHPKFATVIKSPWLWISLGVVTAIVGGVVVSTQIE